MTLSTLIKKSISGRVALIGLSLLAPVSGASAATFGFSFSNVDGPVSGTVSGTIELPDAALTTDGIYAATALSVTSAPAALGYTLPVIGTFPSLGPNAFNVVGGNIILSGTQFARSQFVVTGSPNANAFGLNSPLGTLFGTNGVADASSGVLDSNNSTLTFTRATSVPEPGTILGLVTVGALGALARKRKG